VRRQEFVAVGLDREAARAVGLPVLRLDLARYVLVTRPRARTGKSDAEALRVRFARGEDADTVTVDVAVLGAGPAGLGAALRLARAGHDVVVLERDDRVGGLTASFDVAGMAVDHGSHRLHPSVPAPVLAELRDLLGDELQVRARRGRLRLAGRWVDFPLRAGQLARSLPPGFAVRAALDAAVATVTPARHRTFADHVTTGLGRTMGERFYFPYARKIWGVDPEHLSGEQARRRIRAASPARLAAKVLAPADAAARTFLYPAGGFGRIAEALAEAAVAAGATIRLASPVTELRRTGGGWSVTTSDGERVRSRRMWSTVPVTVLARLLGAGGLDLPGAPALGYRSMVLAYLVVPGGRYSPTDAHYLPSPATPVTRVSEPANYRDGPDPPDRTVLCAEIPCSPGDDVWSAPDEVVGAVVVDSLTGAGLPAPHVREVVTRRVRHAYPVYRVGFEEPWARLVDAVDAQPGLLTFGRQGLFAHDNTHHALAMAWAAADCLAPDGTFDEGGWRRARAAFGRHVVED
jgi:protoporphyrinogen oxidase